MKYFFDTEFNETKETVDLISIGIVADDGREFYAIRQEYNQQLSNTWVQKNVLPTLGQNTPVTDTNLISQIKDFAKGNAEFWGFYASYDFFLLCRLFGGLMNLPTGWKNLVHDLAIEAKRTNTSLPLNTGKHNALEDAKYIRKNYKKIFGS